MPQVKRMKGIDVAGSATKPGRYGEDITPFAMSAFFIQLQCI
jgi:hypothetical protein